MVRKKNHHNKLKKRQTYYTIVDKYDISIAIESKNINKKNTISFSINKKKYNDINFEKKKNISKSWVNNDVKSFNYPLIVKKNNELLSKPPTTILFNKGIVNPPINLFNSLFSLDKISNIPLYKSQHYESKTIISKLQLTDEENSYEFD